MIFSLNIILQLTFIALGLAMFEIVSSMDNAIVNAGILRNIKHPKARQFFVTWGMIMAVGVVRGVLPFLIYYLPNLNLGFRGALVSFWSGDPAVAASIKSSEPLLLIAGGLFLALLFLHWLLAEDKEACWWAERVTAPFTGHNILFPCAAFLLLILTLVFIGFLTSPQSVLSYCVAAATGVVVFFIADYFKEHAERAVNKLSADPDVAAADEAMSDWMKVIFLEIIDMTFSTDGVIGAFAFTMVVPVIMIGNGLGAYIVRRLTLGNVERLAAYPLIKNGAMWAIGILGLTMITEGFGLDVPFWLSPLITFVCVGVFVWLSVKSNRMRTAETLSPASAGNAVV